MTRRTLAKNEGAQGSRSVESTFSWMIRCQRLNSALKKPGFSRAGPARSGRRASRLQCRWK